MSQAPTKRVVLDTIQKLGFKIKQEKMAGQSRRGIDYKIMLDAKND